MLLGLSLLCAMESFWRAWGVEVLGKQKRVPFFQNNEISFVANISRFVFLCCLNQDGPGPGLPDRAGKRNPGQIFRALAGPGKFRVKVSGWGRVKRCSGPAGARSQEFQPGWDDKVQARPEGSHPTRF